jgi:hypothetical protein
MGLPVHAWDLAERSVRTSASTRRPFATLTRR